MGCLKGKILEPAVNHPTYDKWEAKPFFSFSFFHQECFIKLLEFPNLEYLTLEEDSNLHAL
jgi:hypothetical protein